MWTQAEAIELCRRIEAIAPDYGAHVALTGGLLYKQGARKDADILFYRIRQWESIDFSGLFARLHDELGIVQLQDYGWCKKATWNDKDIDFFHPEDASSYDYSAGDEPLLADINDGARDVSF